MSGKLVVSHEDWLQARLDLLDAEKALTRQRDALTRRRMEMPWEHVEKDYRFEGPDGPAAFAELFGDTTQLMVYHFMLAPDWNEGCKSCSFWADHFDGTTAHLLHRDVSFVAVSRAPYDKIDAYKRRMGWRFPWFSSHGSDFNVDYHVSFTPDEVAAGEGLLNYRRQRIDGPEYPGLSVFVKDGGAIFHTYSSYLRGIDAINTTYQMLDLVPKGRDEDGFTSPMAWVRRHDEY